MNDILKSKFGLKINLKAVFIDSHYNKNSAVQSGNFTKYTTELFDFAKDRSPFECKDIQVAKLEIQELLDQIEELKGRIPPNDSSTPGGQTAINTAGFNSTEFALFGVGMCVLGICLGFFAMRLTQIKGDDHDDGLNDIKMTATNNEDQRENDYKDISVNMSEGNTENKDKQCSNNETNHMIGSTDNSFPDTNDPKNPDESIPT